MSDRENLPRWRQRREPTEADNKNLAQMVRIPKRYITADLLNDFPHLDFGQECSYYFSGGPGTGKTHAICAMVRERALSRFDRRECLFITVDDMLSELRSRYDKSGRVVISDGEQEEEARADAYTTRLKEIDVLALDDLGAERSTEWALGELYSIINHRYNELKITYISSNLDLGLLSGGFHQRIASRIAQMCEIINLTGVDRRLRR